MVGAVNLDADFTSLFPATDWARSVMADTPGSDSEEKIADESIRVVTCCYLLSE